MLARDRSWLQGEGAGRGIERPHYHAHGRSERDAVGRRRSCTIYTSVTVPYLWALAVLRGCERTRTRPKAPRGWNLRGINRGQASATHEGRS